MFPSPQVQQFFLLREEYPNLLDPMMQSLGGVPRDELIAVVELAQDCTTVSRTHMPTVICLQSVCGVCTSLKSGNGTNQAVMETDVVAVTYLKASSLRTFACEGHDFLTHMVSEYVQPP